MSPISISTIKAIREDIGAAYVILFAVDENGHQHVATHGDSEADASDAARMGNDLKTALGWPENLCKSRPLPRICGNCSYWKVDWGMHRFNGWTGDGTRGWCWAEPKHVGTTKDNTCGFFSPNA